MTTPNPTATGAFQKTPLLNLLVYALDRQLTGSFVFEEPGGERRHAVYFQSGIPSKARTAEPVCRLGELLVELGHIDDATRERTWAEAEAARSLHGRVLVSAGLLSEDVVRDALREQLSRQIVFLASCPAETLYGYFEGVNWLERWGGDDAPRGHALAIIWRVAEKHADPERIETVLARLGERPLTLHVAAPLPRFHWEHEERTLIEVLRARPQPYAELVARELAPADKVARFVYALTITRQLDLGGNALPLGVEEPPSSGHAAFAPPPVFEAPSSSPQQRVSTLSPKAPDVRTPTPAPARHSPSPELAAFRREIQARAAKTDESYYELLGVTKETPQTDIQPAFLALAKRWHPDRIPPELADVKELAGRVFAKMTEANQVLSDAIQRREYDSKLRRAGRELEEQEHVQRVLRATAAFQRAEVFLRRNNIAAAEAEARRALADNPDEADHIALVAWLDAQKPEADVEASIRALDRAITLQPKNVRALWYRGQLYKRVNRLRRAIQDFRAVVENDSRHVDAQREIRIYNMRKGERGSSTPPAGSPRASSTPAPVDKPKTSESGGFISKLFKR